MSLGFQGIFSSRKRGWLRWKQRSACASPDRCPSSNCAACSSYCSSVERKGKCFDSNLFTRPPPVHFRAGLLRSILKLGVFSPLRREDQPFLTSESAAHFEPGNPNP